MAFPLSVLLLLVAAFLHALSGVPGLLLSRDAADGQWLALVLTCFASAIGLAGVALVFVQGDASATLPWTLIGAEPMQVAVDGLSAFFLVPVLLMAALGSVYGLGYWPQVKHPENGCGLRLFWGILVAGMILLLLARNAVLFLMGWETMALAAFFLVTTEHHQPDVRRAGWIYLVATHLGTMILLALFALLATVTHSFTLQAVAAGAMGRGMLLAAFLLVFTGFGVKAGLMPLHFWLPGAHANAPSHVSAMLSGVVLKMGIYGLIRFLGFLPDLPLICGGFVLVAGCVSGVLGVVFAIGQHDLKRLLAYHSIENIGIILMGLGLALIGQATDRPVWVVLGMAGCLLHVWNHYLFKSLLFFGAGSVIHASGTRLMDRMGGLAGALPWTAAFFLTGAVAICGLPPLNGFVSELCVYMGLFHAVSGDILPALPVTALAIPVLAIIGALALACFVKVYGAVFLGLPRQPWSTVPRESPFSMRLAMGCLAAACVGIGLFPWMVVAVLNRAMALPESTLSLPLCALQALVPFSAITLTGLALAIGGAGFFWWLRSRLRRLPIHYERTWSCGYARPTARMQYTASSFAQMLTTLYRSVLGARVHTPGIDGLFAGPARYETHQDDPVLDRTLLPVARFIHSLFSLARPLQRGLTHRYLIYVALAVLGLLIWTMPLRAMLDRLLAY